MKLFKVVFKNGRDEEVSADEWQIHDGFYLFYAQGAALDGYSFPEASVDYITVISHDVERDFRTRGGGAY